MAFRKTKTTIKPKKLKKRLFALSWCRGASASWKIDYFDKLAFKKTGEVEIIDINNHYQ